MAEAFASQKLFTCSFILLSETLHAYMSEYKSSYLCNLPTYQKEFYLILPIQLLRIMEEIIIVWIIIIHSHSLQFCKSVGASYCKQNSPLYILWSPDISFSCFSWFYITARKSYIGHEANLILRHTKFHYNRCSQALFCRRMVRVECNT